MPDYDLSRLSPRSFEQLVQALAAKTLGPGLIVFGDGPDGGREATFEGDVAYRKEGRRWNGYCVIQAKFRQKPQDTHGDGKWALAQLKEEFSRYEKKERRRPEYYIFATNVVLTPAEKSGGKDRVQAYLGQQSLVDFDVWDYDAIRVMLDADTDIRTAYGAWITPGDVFAATLEALKPKDADFAKTITNYLQKELLGDQYVDLEQAGHNAEDKILLSRVFVDLPIADDSVAEPSASLTQAPDTGIVRQLLGAAAWKLDPLSIRGLQNNNPTPSPVPGRHVIIGGPGQGKTTVGQYLCQLFRASFLSSIDPAGLAPEVQSVVAVLRATCEAERIDLPSARRFPIRIVLNEFASALAREPEVTSLFSYILSRIRKRTNRDIQGTDLRRWLSIYPWFVVLDGLDEVPASTNRTETLAAVEDFWVDASQLNSDLCVLATTRPQGYNKDFSPRYYRHQWLAPLHVDDALRYAGRLVESKYGDNDSQKEKILGRLGRASRNEATLRLMRSPLQVTIMAALVDRTGTPPEERWNLFSQYYKVIYEREMERDIPAAEILRGYKPDVDAIHQRVGLALQIESEKTGGTDARLSQQALSRIVGDRLEEEGHSQEIRADLTTQILEAAMQRLVFLVGVQADTVGFEIRSLQEFMAAEGLMQGSDEDIRRRLEAIARATNWRNVFLFAVGRCFMERQYLREVIYALCAGINDDPADGLAATALLGSQLALDILEDGPARRQPKYAQMFTRLALRLLDLPPHEIHARLAAVYHEDLEIVYREELARRFNLSTFTGAWRTLLELSSSGPEWASSMVRWPADSHLRAIALSFAKPNDTRNRGLYLHTFATLPIDELPVDPAAIFAPTPEWAVALSDLKHRPRRTLEFQREVAVDLDRSGGNLFSIGYVTIELGHAEFWRDIGSAPGRGERYSMIEAVLEFIAKPDAPGLADALENMSVLDLRELEAFARMMPWPLAGCIWAVNEATHLSVLAEQVREGALGNRTIWLAAEERWRERGLGADDVLAADRLQWPFSRRIDKEGFPFSLDYWSVSYRSEEYSDLRSTLIAAITLREQIHSHALRRKVDQWCAFLFRVCLEHGAAEGLDERVVRSGLQLYPEIPFVRIDGFQAARKLLSDPRQWCNLINQIGLNAKELVTWMELPDLADFRTALIRCVANAPSAGGTLRILTYLPPPEAALGRQAMDVIAAASLGGGDEVAEDARVYLRLCSKDWLRQDAMDFGRNAARVVRRRPDMQEWVMGRLQREEDEEAATDFVAGALSSLDEKDVETRGAVIEAVNILLRRRVSSIADYDQWTCLNLPAKLGEWLRMARE